MKFETSLIVSIISTSVAIISLTIHVFTAFVQRKRQKKQLKEIVDMQNRLLDCTCNKAGVLFQGQVQIVKQTSDYSKGKLIVIKRSYLSTGKEILKVVAELPFTIQ